jgi:hypothetical protein
MAPDRTTPRCSRLTILYQHATRERDQVIADALADLATSNSVVPLEKQATAAIETEVRCSAKVEWRNGDGECSDEHKMAMTRKK